VTAWGILVAAGAGTRFGGPKQDALLGGVPLWSWALEALRAGGVDEVVVVGTPPGAIAGGASRRESVAAGLTEVPDQVDLVLVHDAARPLLSPVLVSSVLARLRLGDVDGVVPAVAVRDTLKVVQDGRIIRTVDRSRLVAVQTPQGFRADALRAAHARPDDEDVTDDAGLVEAMGGLVVTVPGDPRNIKVTFPEDLALAEALLAVDPG